MSFLNAGPQHRAWNLFLGDTGAFDFYGFAVRWLLHFDNVAQPNVYLDAVRGNVWQQQGVPNPLGAITSASNPRFGAGSLQTTIIAGDSPSSRIGLAAPQGDLSFGAGNLHTLEGWVFWDGDINAQPMIGQVNTTLQAGGAVKVFVQQALGGLVYQTNLAAGDFLTVGISPGVWHFVAGTFDGITKRLYVDGFLVASIAIAAGAVDTMTGAVVGQSTGASSGPQFIDESRFTIGVARYTGATCPVPTGPFPNPAGTTPVPPLPPQPWNVAAKAATVALSNADFTASINNANGAVRSITSRTDDGTPYYAEITLTTATEVLLGLMTAAANLNIYPGWDANGWAYDSINGDRYNNSAANAYGPPAGVGNVIGILFVNGELSFSLNGADMGVAFAALAGTYFLAWGSFAGAGVCSCNLNTGQNPFAFAPPGVTAWG